MRHWRPGTYKNAFYWWNGSRFPGEDLAKKFWKQNAITFGPNNLDTLFGRAGSDDEQDLREALANFGPGTKDTIGKIGPGTKATIGNIWI